MSGPTIDGEVIAALEGDFRAAMRLLASGVALVTTLDGAGAPCGIAMTAFMSLSMEPPSLLLAINRTASLLPPLEGNGRFVVNILAADQAAACNAFVSTPPDRRFDTLDWRIEGGLPLVESCVATILCRVEQTADFGSHRVVTGLVERVIVDGGEPLVYVDGRYGRVSVDG
ncbi:flavin reductase family protein [Novosphingobium sp. SG707]|uniref:flavin reductase family protein n=1 Tax=Novosphingobium sp. SG707 TaxID=2586996 RepID=UPI001447910C|nr:flavin reductase family protein [Novosphingobium sp. SG707]NKI98600.1 flavin reductase (DIM6/NTAB) family NADH-FMN oxidoreductase RutF [Novosphingobium sp. SG707]